MPITDLELGKLVARVDVCVDSIATLKEHIDDLSDKLAIVDKAMSKGKGIFAGIILMATGIGTVIGIAWKTLSGGQ